MTARADWKPSAHDRAVLAGRPPSYVSPRSELAAAIRRLNARLAELSPEQQAALQADWLASWDELSRQREAAPDDLAELDAVADWEAHWNGRLG
jgi:hypothetical protein